MGWVKAPRHPERRRPDFYLARRGRGVFNSDMSFARATQLLRRRLGATIVATDEPARYAASFDSSKISFLPAAVIKPRREEQIGVVLEIVSELAEQTNILAINATIEATGAGEAGKRFAVVADEIRKLADRTAGSTKEIRVLIDEVRSAVNTTVMATETGAKTVEAGARHFSEVSRSLRQITELAGTATEAAREIELSTKQQSSAVEQVNVAIASVAQATRETETSSMQTLQTASQLSGMSKDLLRVVRPELAA